MIVDAHLYQLLIFATLFLVVTACFTLSYVNQPTYKYALGLCLAVVLGFVYGLRADNIGIDSGSYAEWFETGVVNSSSIGEFLFYALIAVIRAVTGEYTAFFIVVSVLSHVVLLSGLRNLTPNYLLVFAVFVTSFVWFNMNVNIIRQGLALSIVVYSFGLSAQGLHRVGLMVLVLATMVHATAFVFIPLFYLLREEQCLRYIRWIFLLMIFMFFVSVVDILDFLAQFSYYFERLAWYFHWGRSNEWGVKHVYYLMLPALLYAYFRRRSLDFVGRKSLLSLFYGFLLVIIFRFEEMVADRLFYYFVPLLCVLLIGLINQLRPRYLAVGITYSVSILWLVKTYFIQYPNWVEG